MDDSEVHPWTITALCDSKERLCAKCCKEDCWTCSACRHLAAAPIPPRPDLPWQLWNTPNEPIPPLPREIHIPGKTDAIFHRSTFSQGMKAWTEQANLAGSPLPYTHPAGLARHCKPHSASPAGSKVRC